MIYKSKNSGLLTADSVITGDTLVIVEKPYNYFNETKQLDILSMKVQINKNELQKVCSPMESNLDLFAEKFGEETDEWVGRTLQAEIRVSKKSGANYLWLIPTDAEKIKIEPVNLQEATEVSKKHIEKEPTIEYPADEIKPEDIPF